LSYWQGLSEVVTLVLGFVGVLLLRPIRRPSHTQG